MHGHVLVMFRELENDSTVSDNEDALDDDATVEGATADGDGSGAKSKNRTARKTTQEAVNDEDDDFDSRYNMDDYDDENGELYL